MRVLLFSGGVESTCLALITAPDLLLTVDYGQVSANGELRAARDLAGRLALPHRVVSAPLEHLGTGTLAGQDPSPEQVAPEHWPFRNQLLITLALMALATEDVREIVIGTVSTDAVHPDGTKAFLTAMDAVVRAQKRDFHLLAPAADKTTAQLVREAGASLDLLRWTFSCHRGAIACGRCRGCFKTVELFRQIGDE